MPDATDRPTVHDHAVEADPVHDALDGWRSAVTRDLARECRELLRGERPVTDLTLAHLRELSTLLALRDPTWRREVEG